MEKTFTSLVIIGIFIAAMFFVISGTAERHELTQIKGVKIGSASVEVELALTPKEQAQGLSGRSGLNDDEGMLFVFENPDDYFFWMKDMNFSIDMIWIGEDRKIVYIKKDAKPEDYLKSFGPPEDNPAKYVLEVVSGFSDTHDLQEGDEVEFIY
jgi:uncharacterized membrane protein (UPF0127 family)